MTGALYAAGPWSQPEARPLPGMLGSRPGTGSQADTRLGPSEEGWRGVAMTGAHALSRAGVAAPGWDGVMPGCIGVAPPCAESTFLEVEVIPQASTVSAGRLILTGHRGWCKSNPEYNDPTTHAGEHHDKEIQLSHAYEHQITDSTRCMGVAVG